MFSERFPINLVFTLLFRLSPVTKSHSVPALLEVCILSRNRKDPVVLCDSSGRFQSNERMDRGLVRVSGERGEIIVILIESIMICIKGSTYLGTKV